MTKRLPTPAIYNAAELRFTRLFCQCNDNKVHALIYSVDPLHLVLTCVLGDPITREQR